MVFIKVQRFRFMLVKNTYGVSVTFSPKRFGVTPKDEFTGSALQRKKTEPVKKSRKKKPEEKEGEIKLRSLSARSKRKIKKKIVCFSRLHKRLSFVTLTFLNLVTDEQAVDLLRKFVDNAKKRSKDFQYIWIAERQTKNDVFKGNVHFHMITNKYWKIDKWMKYWIDLQKRNDVKPRQKEFNPTSAFDVKQLNSNNIRSISSYVTKYVTKNDAKFKCQIWNCSKVISRLYTDFYTSTEHTEQFERLGVINKEIDIKDDLGKHAINIKMIELKKSTLKLYSRLDEKNKQVKSIFSLMILNDVLQYLFF